MTRTGHTLSTVNTVAALPRAVEVHHPALVILDSLATERADVGEDVAQVRRCHELGLLVLLSCEESGPRVAALNEGADDCLSRPFSFSELVARSLAVLRRSDPTAGLITIGDLVIDEQTGSVRRGSTPITLTATERKILLALARARGELASKQHLLDAVWGYQGYDENVVEVHISSLRKRLDTGGPGLIHTVRGQGYKLSTC